MYKYTVQFQEKQSFPRTYLYQPLRSGVKDVLNILFQIAVLDLSYFFIKFLKNNRPKNIYIYI